MSISIEAVRRFDRSSSVIKLFNPNESRDEFGCPPRLCINTYVGCSHQCAYCYNHWMKGFDRPRAKAGFERAIKRDLERIFETGLGDVIISVSNSTDPLQEPLERTYGHTLLALRLLAERGLRTLILTKNPAKLLERGYSEAMKPDRTAIQVTIPFLEARPMLEPRAPQPGERLAAAKGLLEAGFANVAVRLDPIIPAEAGGQTQDEIRMLVRHLRDAGIAHVISKTFRLVGAIRRKHPDFYASAKAHYLRKGAVWHKNHYMLPPDARMRLLEPVYEVCKEEGITMSTCYERHPFPGVHGCDMAENRLGLQ